jgi:isopenicillin N synthase-like dioxygenase
MTPKLGREFTLGNNISRRPILLCVPLKEVPIVDISSYLKDGAIGKEAIASAVDHACSEIGFMIITGHEVPVQLTDRIRVVSKKFFSLPLEVKMKYNRPSARGYKPAGATSFSYSLGIKTPPDLKEGFSMGPFDLPDNEYYRKGRDFFPPNVWPTEVEGMQHVWCDYFRIMEDLGRKLMRICALALHLPENWFDDKFDKGIIPLVANYYPRQTEKPIEGQLRGGMHTDFGAMTILQRDNSPGGLEVKTKQGDWVPVPYIEDSFVINVGDLMAQWTNDRWVSTLHRVVNPPWEIASKTDRISMPFFLDPNYDTLIEPIETCCGPDNPPKYGPVTAGEHVLMKIRKSYVKKMA